MGTVWLRCYALVLIRALFAFVLGLAVPETFLPSITFNTIFGTQSVLIVLTLAFLLALSVGDSI